MKVLICSLIASMGLCLAPALTQAQSVPAPAPGAQVPAQDAKASAQSAQASASRKPALVVTLATPTRSDIADRLAANGSIAAWQEASIDTELGGLRLAQVLVDVGDTVRKGQLVASLAPEMVQADLAQAQAALSEAQSALAEAKANAARARDVQGSGALSDQQIGQYLSTAASAAARVQVVEAQVHSQQLRLQQTRILAPDDGVISARSATVGAVLPVGQSLFRLVRRNRLEWRAEVTATELHRIRIGQAVSVGTPGAARIAGRVRMLAPTVDPQTRNAIVYVDLPPGSRARSGMFASGEFELGRSPALTVPQQALVVRDGFHYVFEWLSDGRVAQRKVLIGRQVGERVELLSGLTPTAQVVASGAGFLNDGDLVKVVRAGQ